MINCLLCKAEMVVLEKNHPLAKLILWCDGCQYGCSTYPFDTNVYDEEYCSKYTKYDNTQLGVDLNKFRLEFVQHFIKRVNSPKLKVLDFGCAVGAFCKIVAEHFDSYGCEVNSFYEKVWKEDVSGAKYSLSVPQEQFDVVTFFDSLEHVDDIKGLLEKLNVSHVVISIPIVPKEKLPQSRHLRPQEHLHYFTTSSLCKFFSQSGYELGGTSSRESELGREDIFTFYFRKTV